MKTENRINFFDNLPQDLKLDDLVQTTGDQVEKLDLVSRHSRLLERMNLRRGKPYLHAVEADKMYDTAYQAIIEDVSPLEAKIGNLYLHIPFCTKRCTWCHYYKEINVAEEIIDEFPSLITKELSIVLEKLGLEKVSPNSTHFGGGTPSLLSIKQWEVLLDKLGPICQFRTGSEVGVECDPEDLTLEKAAFWRSRGINRISLGIQSFDKDIIKLLKRRHDAEIAEKSYYTAVEAGFKNINIDLMFGMPDRTLASWMKDIGHIMKLRPESVTIYPTRPEPSDYLENFSHFPDEEERIFSHVLAYNALNSLGYIQYSPNQFIKTYKGACSTKRERNQCRNVLGVGPQAHSIVKNWFYVNHTTVNGYRELLSQGELCPLKAEKMSPLEERTRFVQFGLKLSGINKPILDNGVSLTAYKKKFDENIEDRFYDQINFLIQEGLVVIDKDNLHLSEAGIFLNRDIVRYFTMAV
jgi:oxygen-independent coproporphyrinogen-3 oxidase